MYPRRRSAAIMACLLALSLGLAACGSSSKSSSSPTTGASTKSGTIALLLPESKTTRYESQDRPLFTAKLKSLCPSCNLVYSNADQDANKQLSQADAALINGAQVLVLDPVDATSAAAIVQKANAQNVPVISYDRLVTGPNVSLYISFDNQEVGKLQATALLQKLYGTATPASNVPKKTIVMINGSPTDSNAAAFKAGAHSVLDGKVIIAKEYDTPDWSNDQAQNEMQQAITAVGASHIDGVYAANDGTGGGAIAAMRAAGFTTIPPVTGQDAELAGVQRIISGEQYMTVYKAIKPEAEDAAQAAFDLLNGKTPAATSTTNNGTTNVPSILLTPVSVTASNVKDTVVKDGFWSAAQICTSAYAQYCTQLGIS